MQTYQLYSIITDHAQEYKLDKIVYNFKESQQLLKQFNDNNNISVSGLYGSQDAIEQELFNLIHIKVQLTDTQNLSEKGKLIGIKLQNKIIFCLIVSQNFFEIKPIYDKAIELTLFRILQDLSDDIKICLDDCIYDNWYEGDEIPFSPAIVQRQQYNYIEQGDQIIQQYVCKFKTNLNEDIQNYQLVLSQNLSPFFTIIQKLQLDESEIINQYNQFLNSALNQAIQNEQVQQSQCQFFQRQYRFKLLTDHVTKTADEISAIVFKEKQNLLQELKSNKNIFLKLFQIQKKDQVDLENQINQQFKSYKIDLTKQKKIFYQSQEKPNQAFQNTCQRIIEEIEEFKKNNKSHLDKIIKDLKNSGKYSIKKINCRIMRGENKKIENIRTQQEQNQQIIFELNNQNIKIQHLIKIRELYLTKDKGEILLVETDEQTSLYFRLQNSEQFKNIQNYDQEKTKNLMCYFKISHNSLYFFNFNNKHVLKIIISSQGKIEDQINLCEQCINQSDHYIDISVQQIAYLSQQRKFIILSTNNEIFFLLEDSKQIIQGMQTQKGSQQPLKFQIQKNQEQYQQLLSCPSGKYFYYAQGEQCQMFDMNCQEIRKIEIIGKIKVFSDQSDIIILDNIEQIKSNSNVIILANAIQQKTINRLGEEEKQIQGNPSFDIIKGSFIKFGPNSVFLSNSKKKQVSFIINPKKKNQIQTYYDKMNLNNVRLDFQNLTYSEINLQDLNNILFSRVPLQLCTTENGTLIPLVNGFRQEVPQQLNISVQEKAKQLKLGIIEEYLKNDKSKIFVVGIIGKQSSGKSYLLNRVFGTRFSVSSARCTDGIWASIGWIEGQKFLILDCEGLFNSARTNQEEVQMLAFLTAISDVSILNSDITFNRYMNDLFNNLTNASSQLKGESLFKGNLHIVLRDVSSNDNSGIDNELLSNLYRLKSSESQDIVFLKKLFNNNFTVEKLFNFENSKFDEQIINLRQYFCKVAQQTKRWEDGKQLLQMMKILLCQLELSDHGNAYLIDLKLQIEKIIENQKSLWYKFQNNHPSMMKLDQQKYQFPQNEIEAIFFNKNLLKQLQEDLQLQDTIMNHNQNLILMENEFNNLMIARKEQILEQAKCELQRFQQPEMIEIKNKEEVLLANYINNQISQYSFCKEKCYECHLNCNQFKNHIKDYEKLMTKLQQQKKALDKEIAESSIQTDDEEQQIHLELTKITEKIIQIDQYISYLEGLIRKEERDKKLIKCNQELSQYEFCDITNNKLILQNFYEILNKYEIQDLNMLTEISSESLDQLYNIIDQNYNQKKSQFEQNLKISQDSDLTEQELKNSITQTLNNTHKNEEEIKYLLDQQSQLYEKINQKKQKIAVINQEQELLQKNVFEEIDFKIDNNILDQQKENTFSQLQQESQKINQLQIQITSQEQKITQSRKKFSQILNENDLYEVYLEVKKEKEMLKKEIEKGEKQFAKIQELQKVKHEKSQIISKKKIEKLEKDLKISISSDLDKKQNEIENTINLCREQQNMQKFEDLEKFEEFQMQVDKQFSNNQLKIVFERFIDFKNNEEMESKEELQNMQQQIINSQKLEKKLKIAVEYISKQKELQLLKIIQENDIKNIQDELQKITNQQIKIVNFQNDLKRKIQEKNDQFKSLQNKKEELRKENEQLRMNLENIDQNKQKIKNCLQILYEIENCQHEPERSQQQLDECKNFIQFQNNDEDKVQSFQQLQIQKDKLNNQKQDLDQKIQNYSQFREGKQYLKVLINQIDNLQKLQCSVHSCQRVSHRCEETCQVCPEKQCNHKAGHDEKQEHLCSRQDHICDEVCSIKDCQNKCKNIRNHQCNHTCNEKHQCTETCNYCDKICQYDRTESHETHICLDKNNGCNQECELCDKNCSQSHQHSIKRNTYCEKKCFRIHHHNKQQQGTHLCKDIHYCQQNCQKQGICNVEYESVQVTWKSNISEFQYTKYIPKNGGKKKCMHQIPKGQYKHDQEEHICMRDTDVQYHYCDQRCPECQSFCELQYGHTGLHFSSKHRNKDDQKFTQQLGQKRQIRVVSEDGKLVKQYVVGEVSSPETCRESCKRRGRSHFHLIECQGGQKCLEKTEFKIYAKHSKETYYGFENKIFDEILCYQFWEFKMWAHPLQNTEDIDIIQSCDAYCPLCQDKKSFCFERSWHTSSKKIIDHKFSCSDIHQKDIIYGIDIAFVIDTTGSMVSYIQSCKQIIKDILQKFSKVKEYLNQCQFAIISYKDHSIPYDKKEQVVQIQDFASEDIINKFLDSLKADGGDDLAEALLDGLNASTQLSWGEKNIKILYLIADAPPHGNKDSKCKYHNSNSDHFPDGCPCGLEQRSILQKLKELNVELKIVKLNQSLEIMISKFKEDYQNLDELTPQSMKQEDFQNLLIKNICKYLDHNEITFQYRQ